MVVAGCTVAEFGAKGDGSTDDTAAFQAAMRTMAEAGGGTVFIPDGRYAIRGNLAVPSGVTLRGDHQQPTEKTAPGGTLLLAYAGRGKSAGPPFITLATNAGIKDLGIWYPEQDPAQIAPYPVCVQFSETTTVENVTLVNPYQGMINRAGHTFVIRSVCGTPLLTGIQVDNCADTGRIENLYFGPDFWSNSGLPGAPHPGGPHEPWMRANGTGLRLLRDDWQCSAFVPLEGYKTGVEILASKGGAAWGHFYRAVIAHCTVAVSASEAQFPGFLFTHCLLDGENAALTTAGKFDSCLSFHSCTLRGGNNAVDVKGKPALAALFHRCTFHGNFAQDTGNLSLLACSFAAPHCDITLGKSLRAAAIAGCKVDGKPVAIPCAATSQIQVSNDPVPESKLPEVSQSPDRVLKPAQSAAVRGYRPHLGCEEGWDQRRYRGPSEGARCRGSGRRRYRVSARGRICGLWPSPSAFRGGTPRHLRYFASLHRQGSALKIYAGRNDESPLPAIVMESRSGMPGLTFLSAAAIPLHRSLSLYDSRARRGDLRREHHADQLVQTVGFHELSLRSAFHRPRLRRR